MANPSRSSTGGPEIVVCNTCRHSAEAREDAQGRRGGARLADALRSARSADARYAAVTVSEMACLFACSAFCTVHLRERGKMSYVMGHFSPDANAARALLDYAVHYAASDDGQVRYADWPEGVKGHFLTRSPPLESSAA
ncbi:metal-binding protein [Novosphingobium sp. PC22D]|nr:metal-binding protein [Novosphingobium sp. PC22D]